MCLKILYMKQLRVLKTAGYGTRLVWPGGKCQFIWQTKLSKIQSWSFGLMESAHRSIIIHQIFSLMHNWSKHVVWLNTPAKTGEYSTDIPQVSLHVAKNIWSGLHLKWKCAWICIEYFCSCAIGLNRSCDWIYPC